MRTTRMAAFAVLFLGMGAAALSSARAQETHPPKILHIGVEYVKAGKEGTPHQKAEAAVAKVASDAKWSQHYIGMTSLSGASRALFFFPYDSMADAEKEHQAEMAQTDVANKIEQANAEDAELLTSRVDSWWLLRPELSHSENAPLKSLHLFEISRVRIKPGHGPEFEEYLKMLRSYLDKNEPDRHLAVYQSLYGDNNGGYWLLIAPVASGEELDKLFEARRNTAQKMGDADYKRFMGLVESSVMESQRNLYAVDPQMSYPWDEWVKADPFWQKK